MFTKSTVFVIGAGASYECGFPLGGELVKRIAATLDARTPHEDQLLPFIFEMYGTDDRTAIERAAEHLRSVLKSSPSTDDALNWLSDDRAAVELGKIAIVSEILIAERESELFHSKQPDVLSKFDATWLHGFFSLAKRDLKREDVARLFSATTIINFNYDRSVEQYLFQALQQRGPFSEDQARELTNSLDIIRPYGYLGSLWGDAPMPFGGAKGADLKAIAKNILTFTEQRSADVSRQMTDAISNARVRGISRFRISSTKCRCAHGERRIHRSGSLWNDSWHQSSD